MRRSTDPSAGAATWKVEATVVGRSCGEQLALLTTAGKRVSFRVRGRQWRVLDLGQRVVLELDVNGRPRSIKPLEGASRSVSAGDGPGD